MRPENRCVANTCDCGIATRRLPSEYVLVGFESVSKPSLDCFTKTAVNTQTLQGTVSTLPYRDCSTGSLQALRRKAVLQGLLQSCAAGAGQFAKETVWSAISK